MAEAPINIKVNFIAAYSLGPEPHIPINKYIGITAISKNTNMVNRSSEIKNPNTPDAKTINAIKNSFGSSSIFQEIKTPAKTTIDANTIIATVIPSAPTA